MNKTGKNLMAIVMTLIMVITALPVTSLFTAEQVMAADSQSVTVTAEIPGETTYVRHTGAITSGNQYLIVSGTGNNSHLLTNNSGAVDDTTVAISDGKITDELANEANVLWTFTASGNDYKISNKGYYIPLDNNTLSFSMSNTDNVIVEVRTDGYRIHRTVPDGTNRRLRYNNEWGISTRSDYTLNLYEKSIAGQTVALTLTPFVTDLTSKGATSTISKTVKIGDSAATSYDLTWSSSDPDTVTVDENGKVTGIARGSAMITATLTKVNGTDLETPLSASVKVNVEYSLPGEPGTNNREYPAEGSVRINKTASSDRMDSDGLSQVELDVAGVGLRPGVDVVLIVDVSNSMEWSLENSSNGSDALNHHSAGQDTKLDIAMEAAKEFSSILLSDNSTDGSSWYDNTLSFVTFAGYDKERSNSNTQRGRDDQAYYQDSVMTVFTAETLYDKTAVSFNGTKIDHRDNDYILTITNNEGRKLVDAGNNRGNTNYDYAFYQGSSAVRELQQAYENKHNMTYAESGRETYVVFMTDGAPSHYNKITVATANADRDLLPDSSNVYTGGYTQRADWENYFLNNRNQYATALYNQVNGNFFAIGFDLANGGFTGMQWTDSPGTLKTLLETMVVDNVTIPVMTTDHHEELVAYYRQLAQLIKPAGTEAQVIDTVNTEDFTVQLANSVPFDIAGENSTHSFDPDHTGLSVPNMQVKTYTLYTASTCGGDTTKIGKRTGETEVLETVTFIDEGSEAYSDQINNGTTNIMTVTGGVTTINGRYFTYTKDENTLDVHNNPTEKFVWNIGDIPDKEIAFSFYVYLKGSMEGTRTTTGAVYTNIEATLDYIDIDGDHVHDVFPRPVAVWKDAVTEIEFYLVNDEGYPVNHAGQRISRAVRVRVGDITKIEFPVNHSEDEAHEVQIQAAHYLPEGYELYNPDAYYKVRAVSHKDLGSLLTISDSASPQTTFDVLEEEGTYTDVNRDLKLATHVAFGVKLSSIPGRQLVKDVAVIDYAKPIDIDILANDKENIPTGYTAAFEGYKAYANNTDMTKMYPVDSEHTPAASDTPGGGSGTFSKVTSGTKTLAHYVLNKFFNTVDKTFGVVLFENKNNTQDKYYMYNEIDVMPANNIYYEDDFAIGNDSTVGFVYTGTWTTDGSVSGNKETPNNAVHGGWISEDPGLSTDDGYGDGSAHKTETPGAKVKFNFTGTGVDVYTRTNTASGKVRAYLYKVADGKETLTTILFVDNYAKSGDYYQIPTLSINDLEFGTYKLELTAGSVNGTRKAYYIDGIRVYNPIANLESDSVVSKAYGVNELDVTFTNARELLKDGRMAFIDQIYHLYYTPSGGTKTVVTKNDEAIELPNGGVYDEDLGILVDVSGEAIKDKAGRTISIAKKESGDVECVITDAAITLKVPSGCEIGTEANGEAVADYTESAMGKVAPANEIYLDKGQSVIVQTTNGAKGYYLGIKMLDGESTVSVSYGSEQKVITVDHTTDLYYKVIPDSDGQIVISNTGTGDSGKIAITKLRIAGAPAAAAEPQQNLAPINTQAAPTKLAAFRALPLVYEVAGAAAEEPTEPDTIETEIGEDDIVIENPDNFVELEDESLAGIESVAGAKDNKSSVKSMLDWLVKALFGSIRSLFA